MTLQSTLDVRNTMAGPVEHPGQLPWVMDRSVTLIAVSPDDPTTLFFGVDRDHKRSIRQAFPDGPLWFAWTGSYHTNVFVADIDWVNERGNYAR